MNNILKQNLRELVLRERERLGYTQKQMAEMLAMSERSYADIEIGVSKCGTLTVMLLLMSLPDTTDFLQKMRLEFELLKEKEGAI